jgi:wyosine [tRNA(Phe)-imidazoG37] synthetase (radical SAM superfamily)
MKAFGPVPSRRLGRSLGINNIPSKVCSYSCVYCQLGRTLRKQVKRCAFYRPEDILKEVEEKLGKVVRVRGLVDYLTFVPDGEPTLDVNLGEEIEMLKPLGLKVAVISNASLICREDVREDLARSNFVSLKVDAVNEDVWHRIIRPHGCLKLPEILEGIIEFSKTYSGVIVTETMLIDGVNDGEKEVKGISMFLERLNPVKAYIAVPTRPPAERWVKPASEQALNAAYQAFIEVLGEGNVEYLTGYEGLDFAFTGDVEEDLLSIMSVHPMRADAVDEFLRKAGADWNLVNKLIREERLIKLNYGGHKFYMKRLLGRKNFT